MIKGISPVSGGRHPCDKCSGISKNHIIYWTPHIIVDEVPRGPYTYHPVELGGGRVMYAWRRSPFVGFMLHDPSNETGFYGDTFELQLVDGSTVKVKGPWTSNSWTFNSFVASELRWPRVTEVVVHKEDLTSLGFSMQMEVPALRKELTRWMRSWKLEEYEDNRFALVAH